jgi:hypothetical protein
MPPFDPAQPSEGSPLASAVMRSQLTSLKTLIDAVAAILAAQVDGVTTLSPGEPAYATVALDGNTLRFTFGIPRGNDGPAGQEGQTGQEGQQGIPGPPGEVTTAQLDTAITTTAQNPASIQPLNISFSDPPSAAELGQVQDRLNELLTALIRP